MRLKSFDIYTFLDIGSSKIACWVVQYKNASFHILGEGFLASKGLEGGKIVHLEALSQSIREVISLAEEQAQCTVKSVFLSLCTEDLKSIFPQDIHHMLSREGITQRLLNRLFIGAYVQSCHENYTVLHGICAGYILDGVHNMKNTLGMHGKKLSLNFHIVSLLKTSYENIHIVMENLGISVEDVIAGPYVSGLANVSLEEQELGALVIDIGAGTTDVSIFKYGRLIYVKSIAMAGKKITEDLMKAFSLSFQEAEYLKCLYGSVIMTEEESEEIVYLPCAQGEEKKGLKFSAVVQVILSRVEEIFEEILKILETLHIDFTIIPFAKITGGTSQLQGIQYIMGQYIKGNIKQASLLWKEGLPEESLSPEFSILHGFLEYMGRDREDFYIQDLFKKYENRPLSRIKKIFVWIKNNF